MKRRDESHYRGCLIGGALGDALGAPVEFMDMKEIQSIYGIEGITDLQLNDEGIACITDDTQMTLFTAEGILRASGRSINRSGACHPPSVVYQAYLRWFETQYGPGVVNPEILNGWLIHVPALHALRDPGHSCIKALRSNRMGKIDRPINNSKGNGGVMRMAPIGLSSYSDPMRIGCECAAITHGHPSGYIGAGILAQIIREIIEGDALEASIRKALFLARSYEDCEEVVGTVNNAMELAQEDGMRPLEAISELGEGWTAESALAIAIYCSLRYRDDLRQALIVAVNHDGDSDSTGAITGNILGAYLGIEALSSSWISKLELHEVILQVADDLLMGYVDDLAWNKKYPAD